ncbi:uncharacterized protein ACA1_185710 [Acanthamoeba castellanii str. Neff]|uniref:Uncharacterized protein n=1 Tax=Acanthamoeba castellanii (strain ATCC 30010 / Neff) TaxID=1257118 RepID=L8H530_ACACF|nr:uncharacterized protein ACA1_185710 [Acanthamoeba castellanii str. Neff]ELR20347.1 hypothetical protein ACA1_185710 [Acanthamoeba castellanii str. Neff]
MAAKITLLFIATLVAAVVAQDPTSYITAYPARSVVGCGDSPFNLTMQAWQVEPCTYVIKYSIYGRPGISDFGFRSSSGGNGNTCTTDGPYGGWTADGSMVKIDETKGCDQQATFYVKATLTTLITTGSTLALKAGSYCWTCDNAPYGFGPATSCTSPSPTASLSPSRTPSPSTVPPSATPSISASPSRPATPSISASPSSAVSPSISVSRTPSPSVSATPSISATASPSTFISPPSLPPSPSGSPSAALSVSPSPPILSQSEGGASSGAIAGGVVGGIAGVGAAGAVLAGAGYLVHRMMNKPPAPAALTSAFDGVADNAGGVNALFVDQASMQPNPLFAEVP